MQHISGDVRSQTLRAEWTAHLNVEALDDQQSSQRDGDSRGEHAERDQNARERFQPEEADAVELNQLFDVARVTALELANLATYTQKAFRVICVDASVFLTFSSSASFFSEANDILFL